MKFTDVCGRTWDVVIDDTKAAEVKELLGIDMTDPVATGNLGANTMSDFVDVLFVVCRGQHQVTDEEFATALVSPNVIIDMGTAFGSEWLNWWTARKLRMIGGM